MRARLPLNTRSGAAAASGRRHAQAAAAGRSSRGAPTSGELPHTCGGVSERDGAIVHVAVDDGDYDAPTGYDVVDRRSYDGKFATTVPRRQDDGRRRRGAASHAGRDRRDGARARCEMMQRYTHVVELIRERSSESRSSESRSTHTHTHMEACRGKGSRRMYERSHINDDDDDDDDLVDRRGCCLLFVCLFVCESQKH